MKYFDLHTFRIDKELRQEDIAEILETKQSNISRMEKEGINLKPSLLQKLMNKFGTEEIEKFMIEEDDANVISNNINIKGQQTNSIVSDERLKDFIRKQQESINRLAETQSNLAEKYYEISTKILDILDRITQK